MKKQIMTVLLAMAIAASLPRLTGADSIAFPASPKASYMLLADEEGSAYGIPPSEIKTVLKSESGYSQDAIGDHGMARGVAQYHKATFDRYEALYFNQTGSHLSYLLGTDQVKLMAWQWRNYPKSRYEWSTWRRIYGKGSA